MFFKRCWISFLSAVDSVFSSGTLPCVGIIHASQFIFSSERVVVDNFIFIPWRVVLQFYAELERVQIHITAFDAL